MNSEEMFLAVVLIVFVLAVAYYFIGAVMRHRWTHDECDVCPKEEPLAENDEDETGLYLDPARARDGE